jgi:predicted AAA+ superfamily ATPase
MTVHDNYLTSINRTTNKELKRLIKFYYKHKGEAIYTRTISNELDITTSNIASYRRLLINRYGFVFEVVGRRFRLIDIKYVPPTKPGPKRRPSVVRPVSMAALLSGKF